MNVKEYRKPSMLEILASKVTLRDWNTVINYLSQAPPARDREDGKGAADCRAARPGITGQTRKCN